MTPSDYRVVATSEQYRDSAAFWRRQLGDLDEDAEMLAPNAARGSAPRRSIPVRLDPQTLRALERLANDSLGRFTVLAAGIALAVARYFNRTRTLLRTPLLRDGAAATLDAEREVPLVFTLAGQTTLRAFLQEAAGIVADSYSLQDYPVLALLEQERGIDLAGHAGFSISAAALHEARLLTPSPVHFSLDGAGEGRIEIDFDPSAVEPFVVAGLASLLPSVFARFEDLSSLVGGIERVPDQQRERLLVEWNRTDTARSPFRSAHELFEARALLTPEAAALRFGAETVSYRQLNERANRLAHHLLASRRAAERDRAPAIGIWMDRSPWMVVAVLGVLKAGLAYLPIDAECPRDRVAFLLRDSGAARLLIDGRSAAAAATLACEAMLADRDMPAATTNPASLVKPSDLAYVIYTSGSTGEPKGCAIEHHSLSNYLQWANDYYWTAPDSGSMALFTPLSFDLTVPSLFCPLLRGRTLTVYPQDAPIDDVLRRQFAPESPIDSVKLTPSHIRLLEGEHRHATNVRLVIAGGEALTPQHLAILHGIDARIRVVNEYGPTETTVGCIVKTVAAGEPIAIGRPIANTRAYVLDQDQQPVPVGVRGEICIAGAGVARGYHERPALDAMRFLGSPFVAGERLYRTGDIGRWLPGGELECFGRLDSQVKIRGYRVEPGEVAAALRRCDGVRDAVVVARADEDRTELVAYVVGTAIGEPAALRRALEATLPHHMVPTILVGLDELPLTPNGKIDRARLPSPSTRSRPGLPYLAPRSALEAVVAGIWQQLFRLERIGIGEDFFELGGHSLRAMSMMQRIHQQLGVAVSIGEILSHPSIAALAEIIQLKTPTVTLPIDCVAAADHHAVSHGQRRLWLISRIEEESPAYHVSSTFDLRGPIDVAALGRAFEQLLARHESLRTIFVEVDDQPRQRILPAVRLPLTCTDLRGAADQDERLQRLVGEQVSAPFDLGRGPLLRVGLFHLAEARFVLALTLHHIVTDQWSMRVLIAEVIHFYECERTGQAAALPPLRVHYKDYAAWQERLLAADQMTASRAYWLAKLSGARRALDLPGDFARAAVQTYRGRHHRLVFDAGTRQRLTDLGAAHGATPFMTLVAVVKALLYRYTGQGDISIGSPIAGRMHPELADQIGFYVNTLVLRDQLQGAELFGTVLTRVKRTAEEAYAHQAYPFDRLVDELDVRRDLSRSPLFDVMVSYESEPDSLPATPGLTVEDVPIESGVSKFDLTVAFADSRRGIGVEIEYNADLFEAARIGRMASHLAQLVEQITANADIPIDQLALSGLAAPVATIGGGAAPRGGTSGAVSDVASLAPGGPGPVAPRSERELLLVGLLEAVLGRTGIGVTDNYFYIGGDSIKAIQIVNRLARQGWTLRVRDVFEAPTIDRLAARLAPAAAAHQPEPVAGDIPLTPIQRWFFLTQPEGRAHYNQSVMLRFEQRVDESSLRELARTLVQHHDALRMNYRFEPGGVVQFYGEPYDPAEVRDLRHEAEPRDALERYAAAVQTSLDLERGPLARFVLFQMPDGDRLLAVIHHLAVDGVSWRILLEELRIGLGQAARHEPIRLGAKSASFQSWSRALAALAGETEAERGWWHGVERAAACRLPYDDDTAGDTVPDGVGRATVWLESDTAEQRRTLSVEGTAALLSRVHQAYNTRTNDVLLAALARGFRAWAGPGPLRLDLEAHGREGPHEIDVSRTVGWFTALFPVVLNLGDEQDPGRQLTAVKESLRRTPGHGMGYGLLHGGQPSGAPILFNFLGQFDTDLDGFEMAAESRGAEQGPLARMTHDVIIGGWIAEGALHLTARYSRRRFRDETIARLLDAYRDALELVIAHCRDRETTARTASDFRYGDGSTAALVARLGADRIEDVYPLSPMQQGMLYHSVLAGGSPVYVEQFSCSIGGPLDVDRFRAAWQWVIERYTALRTAFFWQQAEQPVQVVFSSVPVPWAAADWRGLSEGQRQAQLETLRDEDRRKGLPLDAPPLLRFTLIRVGERAYRFYWSSHHILMDGWSVAIVLQDVLAFYQADLAGVALAPPRARPFGEYIDWLRTQDPARADAYWRARLNGFSTPTPLPAATPGRAEPGPVAIAELTRSEAASERLAAVTRQHRLTMNTLARGVWALLLADHSRQNEVVYGVTVSGRPASLPGVETIVGLFINTLPIRVRIEPEAPLVEWLHRLQLNHADLDQYASSALVDIQQFSDVPRRTPLFESILVFENYPVDQSLDAGLAGLAIDGIQMLEQTNYPLTLAVVPGQQLLLRLTYDTSRYDEAAAHALLRECQARFDAFVSDPDRAVSSVLHLGRSDDAAPRGRFTLDEETAALVHAIAARVAAPLLAVVERLVAILCFRYSANEDLRCAFGPMVLSRDSLHREETCAAVLEQFGRRGTAAGRPGPAAVDRDGGIDLAFSVSDDRGRVVVDVSCATGRFDVAFLYRTRDHLAALAASIATNPQQPIGRVRLLPSAERVHLLEDFNRTDKDWGPPRTIVQYFEEQAAAHPDRIAVVVPSLDRDEVDRHDSNRDQVWTYGALNARANQLARSLVRRHRVGPDVRVGVLAERSFELVLALMAIEKAGGAYVPLDPEYPRELLHFMMKDCGAAVILTQQKFLDLTADGAGPVIGLDFGWEAIAAEADGNLPSRVTGDSLAYVIYTSGSTGRPKGAMNTHHGIASRLLWMQDAYPLTADDRVLQKTPFSFDVSVWEFFWPLMVGAQLVVAKPGGHRDPAYLVALIADANITTLHFVPSMLQAFVEEPDVDRCTTLQRVICSGEAISPELLRRYTARVQVPLFNLYGPTEAAIDVTAWTCHPADARTMVPIGTPIANTRLYILDDLLQPVPEGITGELFLGGMGVGRGYLNRAELTAARFIPDPFGDAGARVYRTGDLGRYRHDGVVDFLGRIDQQVKLRGFRIELGAIESTILGSGSVRECAVVVREDHPGMKRLVAYVVLDADGAAVPAALRAHLQRTLPDHMVPGLIVPLAGLPRLTNGKLDRKALPAPDAVVPPSRRHPVPRDGMERRLVRVWEDVLGQKNIGPADDFFDLGGHSIRAVTLMSAIEIEFGRRLPLAQLLAHPTVERLAVALQGQHDPEDWQPVVEIRRGGSAPPLFLLPGAGGNVIYFHTLAQHLAPARPVYGLQAIGLDGRTAPLTTVEAIAAVNVEAMRRVAPAGPYFLAGHSFGGRVALEMAQQLLRQGQAVGLLAVLDTVAPTFDPIAVGAGWEDAHWLVKIAREIEEFFGTRLDLTVDDFLPLGLDDQLTLVVERLRRAGAWAPGADRNQFLGYLQVYKANSQAAYPHYETCSRVPVALFKALERDPDIDATPAGVVELTTQRAWGWERFARDRVTVFEVPGAHLSMLAPPHVPVLARAIDDALAAATAPTRSFQAGSSG
ncbi:MAG: amino acid adenylation domain-containing protein [Acidobacteriota bacterium]